MDLGLKGRKALVCASSQGLGFACAAALAREACVVFINGRDPSKLATAAGELRSATRATIIEVPADLNTEAGRATLIAACPDPDILVNNNAGPPAGRMADWDRAAWAAAIEANMLAPIFLIQALLPGMRQRGFGRIVNITSAMVKSPESAMGLSTACRTALTAFSKAVQREAVADNVTINNLLPERFDTGRQRYMADRMMASDGISREEAVARIVETIAAKRFGRPEELGDSCAFICSAQAGFMSGQNIQLDGGSYRGLL